MEFQYIIYSVEDGIASITLNRPSALNAFNLKFIEEWRKALEAARDDQDVKVIIVTGAGRAFSAGADPKVLMELREKTPAPLPERRLMKTQNMLSIVRTVSTLEKPYIAAVNGPAVGGGMDLISLCDIRFASDRAKFGMAFVRMGEIPTAGGCYFLPRIVGVAKACELIWTGKIISAEEAFRIGYVTRVVPHEELMPTVMDFARQLVKGPSVAIGLTKRLIWRCLDLDLNTALEAHLISQTVAESTDDAKEGPRAWLEKREPVFKGR
ncbi:MAG: enoyl-CoA hydratase/isomerase family protein [Chloroflexi bacterium]|nr:enoyl-CoA hydratase/isomerase family protein [Chloroflexota bacterium]